MMTMCKFDTSRAKGAYGAWPSEDSAPDLAQHLTDERSLEVQEVLAKTLGHTGGKSGVGHLIELLKYSTSQATDYYVELGLESADENILIPALKPLLEGPDFRLKVAAARILSERERMDSER